MHSSSSGIPFASSLCQRTIRLKQLRRRLTITLISTASCLDNSRHLIFPPRRRQQFIFHLLPVLR